LDVIDLDTPSAKVIEISSSCELSIFSSRATPRCAEGGDGAPEGSSSMSIGELWPDIDELDEINWGGASAEGFLGNVIHDPTSLPWVGRAGQCARSVGKKVLVDDALGSSSAPPRGRGMASVKNKATQIFSVALGAISRCMQRSFIDRQYSPSTGMDQSEWEIILEELTSIGIIVKQEPDSGDGE
jgi:hypothetical protein